MPHRRGQRRSADASLRWRASHLIGAHLGYPGPNPGYWDDHEFTFGRAMATEITTDGNLP